MKEFKISVFKYREKLYLFSCFTSGLSLLGQIMYLADNNLVYSFAVYVHYLNHIARVLQFVSYLGDFIYFTENKSGYSRLVNLFEINGKSINYSLKYFGGSGTIHEYRLIIPDKNIRFIRFTFRRNFPDNIFHYVVEGDKSFKAAVFIYHDTKLSVFFLEKFQYLICIGSFGDNQGLYQEITDFCIPV